MIFSWFHFSQWTPSILEETDRSSFVFFAAKSSGFQLFSFITFENILLKSSWTSRDPCSFLILFGSSSLWIFQALDTLYPHMSWLTAFPTVTQRIDRVIEILLAVRQSGLSLAWTVSPYVSSSVTLITVFQRIDCVIKILHRPPCLDLWCCAVCALWHPSYFLELIYSFTLCH